MGEDTDTLPLLATLPELLLPALPHEGKCQVPFLASVFFPRNGLPGQYRLVWHRTGPRAPTSELPAASRDELPSGHGDVSWEPTVLAPPSPQK